VQHPTSIQAACARPRAAAALYRESHQPLHFP
jgi:hypothetical protein